MRPTFQTEFGKRRGNCFQACIASLLELPLSDVPNFCVLYGHTHLARTGRTYEDELRLWLHRFGLSYIEVRAPTELDSEVYHVINGLSPRGGWYHSVIGKGGAMVFDPHGGGAGLRRVDTYGLLLVAR